MEKSLCPIPQLEAHILLRDIDFEKDDITKNVKSPLILREESTDQQIILEKIDFIDNTGSSIMMVIKNRYV